MKSLSFAALLADLPDILTCQEAAKALRISRRMLDRLTATGRLRKIKLTPGKTGAARIAKADLLAFLERGAA